MKLLKIEWLKVKSYKTFWIMIGLYVILNILWSYLSSLNLIKFGDADTPGIIDTRFEFPYVYDKVCYFASWLVVLLVVTLSTLVTNEYQYKTHRQNVIDGLSRKEYWLSKILMVVVLSAFSVLLSFIIGTVLGFVHGGVNPFLGIKVLVFQFIYFLNYLSFTLLLSVLVKRSGLVIAIFFGYFMFIEMLLTNLINWKLKPAGDFLLLEASDSLLPFPSSSVVKMASGALKAEVNPIYYVIASLVYIGLYTWVSRNIILKKDF